MKFVFIILVLCYSLIVGNTIKNSSISYQEIDVCDLLKNISGNIDFIINNSKEIVFQQQDNCILQLIDSLENEFHISNNKLFLIALDSLCTYSDGYLSEYFDEVFPNLFYHNFNSLMIYLYHNPNSQIEEFLIWGLSLEVNISEDKSKKKNEIKDFVRAQFENHSYTKEQINYINNTVDKIDSSIWD
jgi:hypothetical protein